MRLHRLEFEKLFPVPKWRKHARVNYMSKATHDAAQNYDKNIERIVSMAMIPAAAFRDGELWKTVCEEAMLKIPTKNERDLRVGKVASKLFRPIVDRIPLREARRHLFEAHSNVEKMWSTTPWMHDALHYYLQTLLIQTQIAHEVLTEDLCKNALDLGLNSTVTPTPKQWNGLGFISRKKTRDTYEFVFPIDNVKIKDILHSPHIDALALVRNVLVHKAGRIDGKFMDGMTGAPIKPGAPSTPPLPALSYFKNLAVRKKLLITGGSVRKLIDPVIPLGYDLIDAIENWIFSHP